VQADPASAWQIEGLVKLIEEVRAMRSELNIPWTAELVPHVIGGHEGMMERIAANRPTLARMAKLSPAVAAKTVPAGSAQILVDGVSIAFPLGEAIDLDAERARLFKAVAAAEKERDSLAARLSNANFTERAKPEAVEKARADHAERAAEAERLAAALSRLG
jgi:valyl-tRNA synthetase